MRKREALKDKLAFIFLLGAAIVIMFPFFWMLSTALKPSSELFLRPPALFPKNPAWSNFKTALNMAPFGRYFLNSSIVASSAVILTVFINLLAGYTFAKHKFKGRKILFILVVSTLMIPMQIIMVPKAFGLFLSKQFMEDIPYELIEAARIDGESEFRIFIKIILPNCKPLIAVLAIFTFMWRWNDFIWPLIITSKKEMYTVQLGMSTLVGQFYVEWNSLMAIALLSILPMLIIFLIFQKFFVQGIATSGLKS
ncbi:MAG: sugar transporter permease [Deferribacteraceae bacterium]|nr:sugar transporter permease [Deferribacteraceae bacterium]